MTTVIQREHVAELNAGRKPLLQVASEIGNREALGLARTHTRIREMVGSPTFKFSGISGSKDSTPGRRNRPRSRVNRPRDLKHWNLQGEGQWIMRMPLP